MAQEAIDGYVMGESSAELDRIHGMHESTFSYMGQLLLAPADFASAKLRILDSGTAGSRWLRDLQAKKGREHEYTGTDMTMAFFPPKGREGGSSDGIEYKVQDITQPWPQEWIGSFDVVHQRFVLGGVPQSRLRAAVMGLISLVKPGGWIQLMESDVREDLVRATTDSDASVPVWRLLRELYQGMGVDPDPQLHLPTWFSEAGLVDLQEKRIVVPVGAKRVDTEMCSRSAQAIVMTAQHLAAGAKQLRNNGTSISFTQEELDSLPGTFDAALKKQGGTYHIYTVWARRP